MLTDERMLQILTRARSAIGQGCDYGLGHGGFHPEAPHPWDQYRLCDCSGFIAWCLGLSRHTDHPWYRAQNGGWLETSAIVRDCPVPFGMFTGVELNEALPCDLIVYGDRVNQDGAVRQGHVGLISRVDEKGPSFAIHCSRGNARKTGDAIQETSVGLWLAAGGIVARVAPELLEVPT